MSRPQRGSDDEDDDLVLRYPLHSTTAARHPSGSGSGGLAPSKSTVYVSNLDYSLTNSDIHTIFSTFGKVARVTVLKDRSSRVSRGVAFVLFVSRTDATAAVAGMRNKTLNGRRLSVSIAADNGRAPEFIRRRVYKDKSRCYECGEEGHLSYDCPKNQLGSREKPNPKKGRRGEQRSGGGSGGEDWRDDGGEEVAFEDDNWASVVDNRGAEETARGRDNGRDEKMKKEKKASYFSDESDNDD